MARPKNKIRDYITKRFQQLYDQHWKNLGKSNVEFAKEVRKRMKQQSAIDATYVSKWYNGTMTPQKYLPAIADVLGVEVSEFAPYKIQRSRILYEEQEREAQTKYGIDLSLLQGMRNLIDFDKCFPLYSPLIPQTDSDDIAYIREPIASCTDSCDEQKLLTIQRDGKVITLSQYDMKTLAILQRSVVRYIEQHLAKVKAELEQALATANIKLLYENSAKDGETDALLSNEMLQAIDSHGMYTDQEKNRWKNSASRKPRKDSKEK